MSRDPTNGLTTPFLFSWFTDIKTVGGDKLHIVLPYEVKIPNLIKKKVDNFKFECIGKTGIPEDKVKCEFGEYATKDKEGNDITKDELIIEMLEVE